jgi:RNA 3'-terminal phosphate cyclase (ATP)
VASEAVAGQTVNDARRFLAAGVPVGKHLADQLMLPYALAGKGSYLTMPLSQHAKTNLEVIRAFLDIKVRVEMVESAKCLVAFG